MNSETRIKALRELEVYGYCKIPGLLSVGQAKELKSLVLKEFEKVSGVQYADLPARNKSDRMVYNMQNRSKLFVDLLTNPLIRSILIEKLNDPYYRVLPPELPNYILAYYTARSSGTKLDLHNDSYVPNAGRHTWAMQVAFALDESREDNGCTTVVPGSHQSGSFANRSLSDDEITKVYADTGDCLIWDSRLWHGTLPNISGRDRWILIATFTSWWVKQTMDIPRGLPQSIYEQLSDEQKALMGFCSIPPATEKERVVTKMDYSFLKANVEDYYKRQE